jgi:hypothetical protein
MRPQESGLPLVSTSSCHAHGGRVSPTMRVLRLEDNMFPSRQATHQRRYFRSRKTRPTMKGSSCVRSFHEHARKPPSTHEIRSEARRAPEYTAIPMRGGPSRGRHRTAARPTHILNSNCVLERTAGSQSTFNFCSNAAREDRFTASSKAR